MITQAQLHEWLHYNSETGQFTWLKRPSNRVHIGDVAGTVNKALGGRRIISIDRQFYYAARLAWFYCHGEWPPKGIDHADLDCANDRLANLRPATQSQNMANVGRPRHNSSGLKGVSFDKARNKWKAQIKAGKKHFTLGRFSTPEEAHAAYAVAASRLHGEFARVE